MRNIRAAANNEPQCNLLLSALTTHLASLRPSQARDRFGNDQRYDPTDVYDSRVLWDVNITGDGGRLAATTFQQVTVATPAELGDGRFQVTSSASPTDAAPAHAIPRIVLEQSAARHHV